MNCTRWRELASDYIEGTLLPDLQAEMRAHTAMCAACRADEAALRSLGLQLSRLPVADPPLFFRENILAAVERQSTRPIQSGRRTTASNAPSFWAQFGQLGRLAFGTALAGSAAAAALYLMIAPGGTPGRQPMAAGVGVVLPGAGEYAESTAQEEAPKLVVAREQVSLPGDGPAYEFSLRLENADRGTARFNLPGDSNTYRFPEIRTGQLQRLQVPFAAADAGGTINLYGTWTANGQAHAKYLFVPVPASETDKAREKHQSFGLPESTLAEAAREIASRYGRPITLEDVPADLRVTLVARGETATQVLRRNLAPHGLRVLSSHSGILIAPAERATSSIASPAAR